MELQELKDIWKEYDNKLDNIEKLNYKIIGNLLSKRSIFKLNIMKVQGLLAIIFIPVILLFVVVPYAIKTSIDAMFIIGLILLSFYFVYYFLFSIRYYNLLGEINITNDALLDTKRGIFNLKEYVTKNIIKRRNFIYPILVLGILLIFGKHFDLTNPSKLSILILMIIGQYLWGRYKAKLYFYNIINKIEKEAEELKEYVSVKNE